MQIQTFYQQFPSFYSAVQVSPHFQSQLIQLAPGEPTEQCDAFFTQDFALYRMRYHHSCLIIGQLALSGFIGVGLVRSANPCIFNGKSMQSDDCFILYPEGDNDLVLVESGELYVFALSESFIANNELRAVGASILDVIGRQEVIRLTQTQRLWQALNSVFDNEPLGSALVSKDLLLTLTGHLMLRVAGRKLLHYRRNSRGNLLSRAVRFILQNIAHIEGCACVAQKLHTSTRSLEKVFRQYLNLSPKEFINVAKVNSFRESIIHGAYDKPSTLRDLTRQLGVKDYASFSKLFKGFYGKSPLQVRQEYAAKSEGC